MEANSCACYGSNDIHECYCNKQNNMKQTAVEWLWLNLTDDMIGELSPEQIKSIYDLVQQAKEMEKEQIIDAWIN